MENQEEVNHQGANEKEKETPAKETAMAATETGAQCEEKTKAELGCDVYFEKKVVDFQSIKCACAVFTLLTFLDFAWGKREYLILLKSSSIF